METQEKKYRLPKEFALKWLAALRSGEYKQGKGKLCRVEGENRYSYCCMGVAGEISGAHIKNNIHGYLFKQDIKEYHYKNIPEELIDGHKLGLTGMCVKLNDYENKSFPEIADWIEQNVELY